VQICVNLYLKFFSIFVFSPKMADLKKIFSFFEKIAKKLSTFRPPQTPYNIEGPDILAPDCDERYSGLDKRQKATSEEASLQVGRWIL